MKHFVTIILLFASILSFSQIDLKTFDYSKADSIALNLQTKRKFSYVDIAFALTKDLQTDQEKFRAIFRWITDSIDYSFENKEIDPNTTIKKGYGVCASYSYLFKAMCDTVGLICEIENGYSKTKPNDINKKYTKTDHAWNKVKINNQWYLIDVTWGAGYYTNKFEKKFKDVYFLSDPDFFYKKHYPQSEDFIGLDKKISLADFAKTPIYYEMYTKISNINSTSGELKLKLKKEYSFEITTEIQNPTFLISLDSQKYAMEPTVSKNGNTYTLTYTLEKARAKDYLTIFINSEALVKYIVLTQ